VINEKLYQGLATQADKNGSFIHGFTYSGHPVCAAVALETLKIYEERDILGHVRKISPQFLTGVRRFADHPLVGEVRAVGLMAGIELVRDKAMKQPFDAKAGVGAFFETKAREAGLLMRGRGEQLVMSPPLIITAAEIDDLLGRLGHALDETAKFVATLT
jgi:4-aminobutyrate--pyruvate transaminase